MSGEKFKYLSEPLKSYLEKVSAKTPAPGGGSVVACIASLSAALINMVLNYTIGKEKYAAWDEELRVMKAENDSILEKLSGYIEHDSEVYESIRKYTAEKNTALAEQCLKESAEIHLDICRFAKKIIGFAEVLSERGNRNLISDTGIAVSLAIASFNTARLNVLINLQFLKGDSDFVGVSMREMDRAGKEVLERGEAVYRKISKILEAKDGGK